MTAGALPGIGTLPAGARRVLVRVDYNVPVDAGRVTDTTRIDRTLATVRALREAGKAVLLATHLGRPDGKPDPRHSTRVLVGPLRERLGEIRWGGDVIAEAPATCAAAPPGSVTLLENLRYHAGEEGNDPGFAETLAGLADAYVNEAFGASHRAHASIVGVPARLPAAAGGWLCREVEAFLGLRERPARPFVAVLGGAKVSDKMPVLRALLPALSALCVGGPMAYTLLAARGTAVGGSKRETGMEALCEEVFRACRDRGVEILLPVDHVTVQALDAPGSSRVEEGGIAPGRIGVDIGPATCARFAASCGSAGTLFWNGPPGIFERAPYATGTRAVAEAIASSRARSVIGGGDTAAAVQGFGLGEKCGHLSTGGGAGLELLAEGDLPGLEALRRS